MDLLLSVDGLSTSPVATGKVSTLTHKVRNDTMERTALVTKTLLTSTQGTEVL